MLKEYIKNCTLSQEEAIEVFDEMVNFEYESEYKVAGLWRGDA